MTSFGFRKIYYEISKLVKHRMHSFNQKIFHAVPYWWWKGGVFFSSEEVLSITLEDINLFRTLMILNNKFVIFPRHVFSVENMKLNMKSAVIFESRYRKSIFSDGRFTFVENNSIRNFPKVKKFTWGERWKIAFFY